jgi:hypothetical protein
MAIENKINNSIVINSAKFGRIPLVPGYNILPRVEIEEYLLQDSLVLSLIEQRILAVVKIKESEVREDEQTGIKFVTDGDEKVPVSTGELIKPKNGSLNSDNNNTDTVDNLNSDNVQNPTINKKLTSSELKALGLDPKTITDIRYAMPSNGYSSVDQLPDSVSVEDRAKVADLLK